MSDYLDTYDEIVRNGDLEAAIDRVARGGLCPVCGGEGVTWEGDYYSGGNSEECPLCKAVERRNAAPSDNVYDRALDRMGNAGLPF